MAVAVAFAVAIGIPLGILAARSRTADYLKRPILDGMQTMPSFVYLLPGILFFGLGKPAGIFATIICGPTDDATDQLGNTPGLGRDRRSFQVFRSVTMAVADHRTDTHGPAYHHGRYQPDHDDGPGNGDHSRAWWPQAGWVTTCCGRCEERAGQWGNRRTRYRVSSYNYGPLDPVRGRPQKGYAERRLATATAVGTHCTNSVR